MRRPVLALRRSTRPRTGAARGRLGGRRDDLVREGPGRLLRHRRAERREPGPPGDGRGDHPVRGRAATPTATTARSSASRTPAPGKCGWGKVIAHDTRPRVAPCTSSPRRSHSSFSALEAECSSATSSPKRWPSWGVRGELKATIERLGELYPAGSKAFKKTARQAQQGQEARQQGEQGLEPGQEGEGQESPQEVAQDQAQATEEAAQAGEEEGLQLEPRRPGGAGKMELFGTPVHSPV